MVRVELEAGLCAYRCPISEGVFLPISAYSQWLSKQSEKLPHLPGDEVSVEFSDSETVKICPESGQLMQRYKVGHGFDFYLDRSPSGSVWFDKGEWDSLRARQFHDELHLIFTFQWQNAIRDEEKEKAQAALLTSRLGDDLVNKLDQVASLLSNHEHKAMALAYLHRQL